VESSTPATEWILVVSSIDQAGVDSTNSAQRALKRMAVNFAASVTDELWTAVSGRSHEGIRD
jgi:hypothetical protein